MARVGRSIIGIELQERHIRAVEVLLGNPPTVIGVGDAAMPPGAIHNGSIARADMIAVGLRKLLDSMGAGTDDAVLGVPAAAVILRTLTIPPAPDSELSHIVDGEVKHYRLLNGEDAVYNYFPMHAAKGGDVGSSLNVLLAGAEGPIVTALRDVAAKASLNVAAIEPVQVALYRSAAEDLGSPSAMVLAISETRSDVVLHSGGEICLFREVDFGANSMLVRQAGDDPFVNPSALGDADTPNVLNPNRIHVGPANNLAIELKRSIEYFNREYTKAEPIDKLIIATTEPGIEEISGWLSHELNLPVSVVSSYKSEPERLALKAEMSPPSGSKYAVAYGLAMRGAYLNRKSVPAMDLYIRERSVVELQQKQRSIAGSLVLGIIFLLVGFGFAFRLGREANKYAHENFHLQEDIEKEQAKFKQGAEEEVRLREQYDLLKQDGVPLSSLMDSVAARMVGNIGITDLSVDNTGKITIQGEVLDENTVIKAADSLKSIPLIKTANVSSFEKVEAEGTKPGYRFSILGSGNFGKPPKAQGQ